MDGETDSVGDDVGGGETVSLGGGEVGDGCGWGEVSFFGDAEPLGVGDLVVLPGVAAGVGDFLRAGDGDAFDFDFGVDVDFGVADGTGRSAPMRPPRPRAAPALDGVADGFTVGLKKVVFFGVGLGVGLVAAIAEIEIITAIPKTKMEEKILRVITSFARVSGNKCTSIRAMSKRGAINFARTLTDRACTAFIRLRARPKTRAQFFRKIDNHALD